MSSNQQPATAPNTGAWITFAILTLVVSLAVAALGFVPWAATAAAKPPEAPVSSAPIPQITETWPDGDLRVPIVGLNGHLGAVLLEGAPVPGITTQEAPVVEIVRMNANDAGLGQYTSAIVSLTRTPYKPDYLENSPAYPYAYPELDRIFEQALTPEHIEAHRDVLIDLSSSLLYADMAAPAYSLLNRMRNVANTCHTQLNLALTVALGYSPELKNIETEFEEAIRQCPDEPAAYSTYVQVILAHETRGFGGPESLLPGEFGQEEHAMQIVARQQQAFPQHAAGYLSEAAVLLEIADKYRNSGVHPFTARQMYQRALDLLRAVEKVQPDDPTVLFGQAIAMAGLGHPEEAHALAVPQLDSFTAGQAMVSATRDAYAMAPDIPDVSSARALDQRRLDAHGRESALCRSLLPVGHNGPAGQYYSPIPGYRGACHVVLVDATGGIFAGGMDTFAYHNYIPRYRNGYVDSEVLDYVSGEAQAERLDALFAGDFSIDSVDSRLEYYQDGFRRIGDYEQAEKLLRLAIDSGLPLYGFAQDRLGEVLFLQGRYEDAAKAFKEAYETLPFDVYDGFYPDEFAEYTLTPGWAAVKQAASLQEDGKLDQAAQVLADLPEPEAEEIDVEYGESSRALSQRTLLGSIQLAQEEYEAAAATLQSALDLCPRWNGRGLDPCVSGVQANNLGIALIKAGRPADAVEPAKQAMAADPANAMFAELLANALEADGDVEGAIAAYQATVASDPRQFTAHNNLGVLLANKGDIDGAIAAFRNAVGVRSSYARGWFNLGTALANQGGLANFIWGQGALGRAAAMDAAFRGADPEYLSDVTVYDSGLDLSKPLPPDWSAANERQPLSPTYGIGIAIVAILQAVRALAGDHVSSAITERLLGIASRLKLRRQIRLPGTAVISVLVSSALVAWGLLSALPASLPGRVVAVLVALMLPVAFVCARLALAPRTQHTLSAGGTLVGLACAPVGIGFAPVPVLNSATSAHARWAPQYLLAVVSLVAIGVTVLTGVPLARVTSQAALMVLASSLVPLSPFDGEHLPTKLGLPVAIGLALPTVAFAMHLL